MSTMLPEISHESGAKTVPHGAGRCRGQGRRALPAPAIAAVHGSGAVSAGNDARSIGVIRNTGLDTLYASHRGALVGYAGRILGDVGRAEEVVQEAFIRFSASAETTIIEEPVSYLYRTVRNLCLDTKRGAARDHRRDQVLADALGDIEGIRSAEPTPETLAVSRQELRRLQAAMAELPERMRRALELHRISELSVKQVAAELGVSVGTAHGLIVQALEHCRQRLDRR